jgi:type III secretory pathway component EscV
MRECYQRVLGAPFTAEDNRQRNSTPLLPVTTPIFLEVDANLFPPDDDWSETHPLFVDYLPQMRQRLREEMGVWVPGTRVRASEMGWMNKAYLILFDEVPLVMGYLDPDYRFYPEATSVATALSLNPRTGRETGAWLAADQLPAGLTAVDSWDYFQYMVYHLESVLKENLAAFLGIQELTYLLADWLNEGDVAQTHERGALQVNALPDEGARLRLLQVCQYLLYEGVSIADLQTILTVFQEWDAEMSPLQVSERCRRALRSRLPGNEEGRQLIGWSEPFEQEIRQHLDENQFLALPPEVTQNLLTAVRQRVSDYVHREVALVVQDGRLRPFVRRLTAFEFPKLAVLAAAEISDAHDPNDFLAAVIYPPDTV